MSREFKFYSYRFNSAKKMYVQNAILWTGKMLKIHGNIFVKNGRKSRQIRCMKWHFYPTKQWRK